MHHEFHGRVVIIQHQHFVHRRLFRGRFGADGDAGIRTAVARFVIVVAHEVHAIISVSHRQYTTFRIEYGGLAAKGKGHPAAARRIV